MPRLPELTYKQMISLLKNYKCSIRGEGSSVIVGRSRNNKPFTIHQHQSQKVFKAKLSKILKYAEISHEEFWNWYHKM